MVIHYINSYIAIHHKLFQVLTPIYLVYIDLFIWNAYHEVRLDK